MRRKKKWFIIAVLLFAAIQFIQPARNKSGQVFDTDITRIYPTPENVRTILTKACYDCHSNNTQYPWYAYVQPGGWWLAKHVKDGKKELNLQEFALYSNRKKAGKLRAIGGSIKDGSMPLGSYKLLHPEARLTAGERAAILQWLNNISVQQD